MKKLAMLLITLLYCVNAFALQDGFDISFQNKSEHFTIYSLSEIPPSLPENLEKILLQVSQTLGVELSPIQSFPFEIKLCPTQEFYIQVYNICFNKKPQNLRAFSIAGLEDGKGKYLPTTYISPDYTDGILSHEITHLLLYHYFDPKKVPLQIHEILAIYMEYQITKPIIKKGNKYEN